MGAEVAIEMKDGRTLRATHDAGIPQKDVAQQGKRLKAKFERLVEPALGAERCWTLLRLVDTIERTPATELMAACAAGRNEK